VHPEKCTHKIVIIKIKGYGTSPPGFNPIVRSRTVAGLNAELQRASQSSTINQRVNQKRKGRTVSISGPSSPDLRPAARLAVFFAAGRPQHRDQSHRVHGNALFLPVLFFSRRVLRTTVVVSGRSHLAGDHGTTAVSAKQRAVCAFGPY